MILGFTGTSRGMTDRQRATVKYLFNELHLSVLHHGCCIKADAEAHALGRELNAWIVGHPPIDKTKMAAIPIWQFDDMRPPYSYLTRDRHIVRDGRDGLVAAPKDFIDKAGQRGEGTWTTIGYARKAKRRIWIVFPDGTFKEESISGTTPTTAPDASQYE